MVHEVIVGINIVFQKFISQPSGEKMQTKTKGFQDFYGLSCCHGAIEDTHFTIAKPSKAFLKDYYYHK
jgi:hypothetical protein